MSVILFPVIKVDGNQLERLYLCHPKTGKTPVLKEEGTFLEWFPIDKLPANIAPLFALRIAEALKPPADPVTIIMTELPQLEYLKTKKDFSSFYKLEEWTNHPTVVEKRRFGKLRFDPIFSAG
ncbi:MAG: hypothetical protein JWM96_677 [Alphaproteobacteria bacterium]|nr:hypothetical protein [Alphaproteobacteria bacterium]